MMQRKTYCLQHQIQTEQMKSHRILGRMEKQSQTDLPEVELHDATVVRPLSDRPLAFSSQNQPLITILRSRFVTNKTAPRRPSSSPFSSLTPTTPPTDPSALCSSLFVFLCSATVLTASIQAALHIHEVGISRLFSLSILQTRTPIRHPHLPESSSFLLKQFIRNPLPSPSEAIHNHHPHLYTSGRATALANMNIFEHVPRQRRSLCKGCEAPKPEVTLRFEKDGGVVSDDDDSSLTELKRRSTGLRVSLTPAGGGAQRGRHTGSSGSHPAPNDEQERAGRRSRCRIHHIHRNLSKIIRRRCPDRSNSTRASPHEWHRTVPLSMPVQLSRMGVRGVAWKDAKSDEKSEALGGRLVRLEHNNKLGSVVRACFGGGRTLIVGGCDGHCGLVQHVEKSEEDFVAVVLFESHKLRIHYSEVLVQMEHQLLHFPERKRRWEGCEEGERVLHVFAES
ncbi:hypothetical protein BLNAU_20453 [Blattamonas nauphoetae]|uniref:Uncharacterized protein n=1 Tax=Blattamonas nauphoetae TaxID=2049346 RepID=A0ABQ9WYS1_9EUKA|nr:hypothetical protein BLNAU_20453 [Blattamonas nauphoetae]